MKQLTKTYQELRNKKNRKGFTLVELLVVIAILAVLASVSVVGYLGFTTKAKNSNALTELSQAKELIRSELIDGEVNYYSITTDNNNNNSVSSIKEITKTEYTNGELNSDKETSNTEIEKTTSVNDTVLDDTKDTTSTFAGFTIQYAADSSTNKRTLSYDTKGSYTVSWNSLLEAIFTDLKTFSGTFYVEPSSDTSSPKTITSITYVKDNGKAKWTLDGDTLDQGDNVSAPESTNNLTASAS